MRFDGGPVVRPDLDVDAENPPAVHRFHQGGVEHQGTAVRHAGLDHQIRLEAVDNFLEAQQVVRELDDGAPHPREGVGMLLIPSDPYILPGDGLEGGIGIQGQGFAGPVPVKRQGRRQFVDGQFHRAMLRASVRGAF